MPDLIHVHTHDDQCLFIQGGGTGDFTPEDLDAAAVSGVLRQGTTEVPFADLGVLRVQDNWDGDGRSNAGQWLPIYDDEGTCRCTPQGLQRGPIRMPPQAFRRVGAYERMFGIGAFGLEPAALQAVDNPDTLTWGFELETHASAGAASGGSVSEGSDPDAWVMQQVADPQAPHTRDAVEHYASTHAAAALAGEPVPSMRDSVLDWLRRWVRDHGVPATPARDWLRRRFRGLPVDVGTDGTVRGFEIRTVGGLTAAEFERTARQVLEVPHTVHTGCSFHIHVKLPGERRTYSREFHRHLTEYLACNVDRLPASVRERLASPARDRWFAPTLDEEKFRIVHCSQEHGTWEFRLFGNLNTLDDALACRRFAEAAVQHALRVAVGQATPLLAESNFERLQALYATAFSTGRPPAGARRAA